MFVNTKKMSKVPDKPIDLSAPAETTQKENSKTLTLEDVSPIASLEHPDQIGTFKVDDAGLPIFGEDGRPIEDPNGQQVYAQIDKEGNMMTDPTGKPVFVSPDNVDGLSTQRKVNKAIDTHAAKRIALPSTWRLPLIGVPKFVAGKLITGMSMKIPFTGGKVIGFGVKNAVATAVHAELATLKVSKTIGSQIGKAVSSGVVEKLAEKPGLVKSLFAQFGSKTAAATEKALVKTTEKVTVDLASKGLSNATVNTTEGIVKALTKEGALGKGIAPVKTMYEAAKDGTVGLIKGMFKKGTEEVVEAGVKAGTETIAKTAAKTGAKTAAKTGAKVSTKVAAKAGTETAAKVSTKVAVETTEKAALKFTEGYAKATIGAGEVVLKESVTKGVEKGIKLAVSRSSKEVGEKLISETAQKTIQKAAEKAAVEATGKGTAKAGVTLAKVTHHIGTGINAAITVYDTYDAYKKFKDPNVTGISKALATTTVVLDGVSTYYSAKGVGGWKSWVATGGSMITSIASDYTKYKK